MNLNGKTIFITGGTGSFGKACIETLLAEHDPRVIRVFSRDELKQSEMQAHYSSDGRLRFFLGDVRDRNRLIGATRGVDLILHAAALKQVPACEYNPFEAAQTNIIGAENVVAAAIANEVPRTLLLSTDKAVNPVNLYGATKLCAEKISHPGKRAGRRLFGPVRQRTLRQRRRQPRQRDPDIPRTGRHRPHHDHRRAHDAILDNAAAGGRLRPLALAADGGRRGIRPEDPQHAR